MIFLVVSTLLFLGIPSVDAAATLHVNAWQSKGKYPIASDYPESLLPEISSRPSTAIAFSGGGSRSFAASTGYLAGLNKLGLLENVRYIGGISGGSWVSTVFTYAQNVSDDAVLLGDVVSPEDIVDEELATMNPACMRRLTTNDLVVTGVEAMIEGKVKGCAAAFCYGLQEAYLTPIGVPPATRFSWSETTVADIRSRNPELTPDVAPFVLPGSPKRPYLVIGSALVGPASGAPYHSEHHNFTMTEFTPLYAGQARTMDVEYLPDHQTEPLKRRVGGLLEAHAFNRGNSKSSGDNDQGDIAPSRGLPTGVTNAVLDVPVPEHFLDLSFAAGSSGYAVGAFMESSYIPTIADKLGLHHNYWSPTETDSPVATDMLYTDGGCYENEALIPFLQREVSKIILFLNPHIPLQPSTNWDVQNDEPSRDQLDTNIAAFFGVFPPADAEDVERNYMLGKDQVFPTEDYTPLVLGLQAAQAAGKGIVFSMNLTTVENEWWGVAAGHNVEVTFVYLGRLSQWEAQLSVDMQSRVVPTDGDPSDLSNTIDSGEFKGYPHYITAGGLLSPKQTNLLADMSGWVIERNEEIFKHMLS